MIGLSAKDCSAFSSVSISYVDISFANSMECLGDDDCDDADSDSVEKDLLVRSVPAGRKVFFCIVPVIGGLLKDALLKDGDCVKALLEPTSAAVSENSVRVILLLYE